MNFIADAFSEVASHRKFKPSSDEADMLSDTIDVCKAIRPFVDLEKLGDDAVSAAFIKLIQWEKEATKEEKAQRVVYNVVLNAIKATKVR